MKTVLTRTIFGNGKSIEKKTVLWNMVYSVLFALQSAVMLLLVTRIKGAEDAGIFSIAYTTAQLLYVIGSFNLRNFQATDTCGEYTFREYRAFRIFSCGIMLISCLIYCAWRQYGSYKTTIIYAICIFKIIEAVENLYHGELQRIGRLDVAGRTGTLRLLVDYFVFFIVLLITRNLPAALCGLSLVSILILGLSRSQYGYLFHNNNSLYRSNALQKLTIECFPLFLSGLLSLYICNAPKYALDTYLPENVQAYFAVLFMPIFTINLLSGIVYSPKLKRMASLWNGGKQEQFGSIVLKQLGWIILISMTIILFGTVVGLRILEIVYGMALRTFRSEFMILLFGGGFVSIFNFLVACITVMRKQFFLVALVLTLTPVAAIVSNMMVSRIGMIGACWAYLLLMICEALTAIIMFFLYYQKGLTSR